MLRREGMTMAQRTVSAVRLNRKGLGTILRDDLGRAATAKAHEMADNIKANYPDLADAVRLISERYARAAAG